MIADEPAGLRILLVEDEPANRSLFRAVLARAADAQLRGACITEADTLAAARAALAESEPDLVALDVRLPDGDGLVLAEELVGRPSEARPRIVTLSASARGEDRAAARLAGSDGFVAKPYRPAELLAVIEDVLPRGS